MDYIVKASVEGLTAGYPYIFRYRGLNKYGWGEYSEPATYLAADRPSQSNPVTTTIENQYVKISWQYPIDSSSAVVEYQILIQQADGIFSEPIGVYCQGSELTVVGNRYCHIPMTSVIRQPPYSLQYGTLIVA